MKPDSLESSIQNLLSDLYPPFEATAPTVLSQLFQTIEGRYHGDALRCLLDFLVPAKHILESVQQAACAQFSDVIFLCEGWPLCLCDQVVIHLAPISPLLLEPGDFYLQVAPFCDQSARIVLCSLLVEEEILVGVVEETPVPETCYPCLFSYDWLEEFNRGRHGTPLSQCLLANEQGVVRLPWKRVAVPEFMDGSRCAGSSMASAPQPSLPLPPPLPTPPPPPRASSAAARKFPANPSLSLCPTKESPTRQSPGNIQKSESDLMPQPTAFSVETRIRPAKHGIAVSLRLVDTTPATTRVVKVRETDSKPIGSVSSNTWDSRGTDISPYTATTSGRFTTVKENDKSSSRDKSKAGFTIIDLAQEKHTDTSARGKSSRRPEGQVSSTRVAEGEYIDILQAAMLFGDARALRNTKEETRESQVQMELSVHTQAPMPQYRQTQAQTETHVHPHAHTQIHQSHTHSPQKTQTHHDPRSGTGLLFTPNIQTSTSSAHHSQPLHPHPDSSCQTEPSRCVRFSEEPCTPCMRRRQGGKVSRAQELRCRYRDSYQAAIQNPVALLVGSNPLGRNKERGATLAMLEEDSSQCEGGWGGLQQAGTGDPWLSDRGRCFDPGMKNLPSPPVCGAICKESGEMNTASWWNPGVTNTSACVEYRDTSALTCDRQQEQPNYSPVQDFGERNTVPFMGPEGSQSAKSVGILHSPNGTDERVGPYVNTFVPMGTNDLKWVDKNPAKPNGLPSSSSKVPAMKADISQPAAVFQTRADATLTELHLSKSHSLPHSKQETIEQEGRCSSLSTAVVDTSAKCEVVIVQGQNVRRRDGTDSCAEMVPRLHVMKCKNATAFGLVSPKINRRMVNAEPAKASIPGSIGPQPQNTTQTMPSPALETQRTPQPGPARSRPDHLPLGPPDPAVHPLFQGVACLTGGRDRGGRAVVEVYGDHHGWRPDVTSKELYQMLLYFHSVIRREVRELGMTIAVDARRAPPPPQFFKALVSLQECTVHSPHSVVLLADKVTSSGRDRYPGIQIDVMTSTKALNKVVDVSQLTSRLEGTLSYNHCDWLELHQKLQPFVSDLHESSSLLQRAIRRMEETQEIDSVQHVQQCMVDQRVLMRNVLEDSRLVGLQREGGAILARLRRESDLKYPHCDDFSDAVDSVTSLYNHVEEQAHMLVQSSNRSLEHLEFLLRLREMEAHLLQIKEWFDAEGERHLLEAESVEDSKERVEQTLNSFTAFLIEANDRKHHAMSLVSEAERLQGCGLLYPEAEAFGTLVGGFRTRLDDFLSRADACCGELQIMVDVCDFCDQATALATECIDYLDGNPCSNPSVQHHDYVNTTIYPVDLNTTQGHYDPSQPMPHLSQDNVDSISQHCQSNVLQAGTSATNVLLTGYDITVLRSYQGRFHQFDLERFQEVKTQASTLRGARGMRVWNAVWLRCQEARQQLQERVQEVEAALLQRQQADLWCGGDDVTQEGANDPTGDGENSLLQSTPGPRHPQWQGIISGTVDIEKRRPILGSSGTNADFNPENTNDARANKGSKVPPASPGRPARRTERETRREMNARGRRERDASALSRSHTVGCQWFPWGRGLGSRSVSEESCATVLSPPPTTTTTPEPNPPPEPRVPTPSSCSHHGQPSCRILQEAQRFQLSRHGSFCSQESCLGAGVAGANGASCCKHSSLPIQRCEGTLCLASPDESTSNALRLQRVMEELVFTEREYVRSLGYILTHYHPLLERPDIPQDLRGKRGVIFGNLEKLYNFHSHRFLPELEACRREPALMARCFLRHSDSFGLYALYSKNKPKSDTLILHRRHDIFKRKQQELGDLMDLSSYLLRPIQRISKYSLLLQDMQALAATLHRPGSCEAGMCGSEAGVCGCGSGESASDATGSDAEREKAEIRAAADLVKFQMRHGNDLLTMDAIQDCDVNLKEQGQLIRQDEFTVFFRKKKCIRRVFLFEHLVLFSKTKRSEIGNDVYVYKQSFKTCDIGMTHNAGVSGLCFEIWFRRRKSADTYTLKAFSMEVKKAWTTDLERILWEQAALSRELRLQERVFMGMGRKPFMDIQHSDAAICDRAVNCDLPGRIPVACCSHRGVEYPRPNSIGSGSTASTTISQSSSSSGRGSLPPIGFPGGQPQGVKSNYVCSTHEALADNELNNLHLRQHHLHHHSESRASGCRVQTDSTESSPECISPFSSERSCLSAIDAEALDSSSSFAYPNSKLHPTLSRTPSLRINSSPALNRRRPSNVPRPPSLTTTQGTEIFIGKSTEV